MLGLWLNVNPR